MKTTTLITGIPFHPVTYPQAVERIGGMVESDGQHYIVTPNPEMLVEAGRNPEFREILQHASLSIPDGIGILWAAYYLSLPKKSTRAARGWQFFWSLALIFFRPKKIRSVLPQRVTGSDLLRHVVDASQTHKWRVFLLGAAPGVARRAIDRLLESFPEAIFAGAYAGSPHESDFETIQKRLEVARPDILFVAYGSPSQEEWIARHLKDLASVKVAIGVGGAFDFAAQKIRRAPAVMRRLGVEWLFRLILQPRRWKRIWTATGVFVRMVYFEKMKN